MTNKPLFPYIKTYKQTLGEIMFYNSTSALLSASLLTLSITNLNAQEEVEMESNAIVVSATADENGSVMGTRVMSIDSSELGSPMVFADSFGDNVFSFGSGSSGFSMLNNPSVQKDLNLVDEQLNQIKEINDEFSKKIQEKMSEFRSDDGGFQIGNAANFGEMIKELQQQQQDQIDSILLPNQQARLQQVSRQMKMNRMGSEKALTQHLAEELGISDEQKERIEKKSKELKKDLDEKIAELKARAKKELLNELSKDQQKKLEELLGDEFVVKEEDSKNRIERMLHRHRSKTRDF